MPRSREDELVTVTCGVCGKQAVRTEQVMDTWQPYAYFDGQEVSPVCPDHPGHIDEDGTFQVDGPLP